MAHQELRVDTGNGIVYKVKPNVSGVLGSDVLIQYGTAEDLASAIVSTVEEGCIRTRKCHFMFNALPVSNRR